MRFVCWLWRGKGFWKQVVPYGAEHVAALASMLQRHGGHQLTCIHDGSFDLPSSVDGFRMPAEVARLPDYLPKLWAWSDDFHELIGERFTSIDLDTVILNDPAPLFRNDQAGIRIWNSAEGEPYNTSFFTLDPGYGRRVWKEYSPEALDQARASAQRWTGDQSWVAHVLGPNMPVYTEQSGLLRYRPKQHRQEIPAGTIAAFFCGPLCPKTESERSRWVRAEWI